MPNLEHLSIRGNNISTITDNTNNSAPDFHFPATLRSVDLSHNKISTWTILNHLPSLFPGLTTLRVSGNPLFDQPPLPPSVAATTGTMSATKPMTVDEAFMLTLSRFPPTLRTLNYSSISLQDRSNAEMYYLSLIGKELSATSAEEEPSILATHPRYSELCHLYGEPTITRAFTADGTGQHRIHPQSVAARLIKMAFRLSKPASSTHAEERTGTTESNTQGQVYVKEIPTSFNSYQVKALVSRIFSLPVYGARLIWETDEFDPIERGVGEGGVVDSDDESEGEEMPERRQCGPAEQTASRFVRREIELVDSMRDIGFLFQGETGEMRIRVEVPPV